MFLFGGGREIITIWIVIINVTLDQKLISTPVIPCLTEDYKELISLQIHSEEVYCSCIVLDAFKSCGLCKLGIIIYECYSTEQCNLRFLPV
jgi:hypothetical protein